jgi:hypothetical protein
MLDVFRTQVLKPKGDNWAVFGTFSTSYPKLRNVVIRKFHDDRIYIYTHGLSDKVQEIQAHPQSSICWYSKRHHIQLQFYGVSTLIDPGSFEYKISNFRDYLGGKPGSPYTGEEDSEKHFSVIEFQIEKLIGLKLGFKEHLKFERDYSNSQTTRVIP